MGMRFRPDTIVIDAELGVDEQLLGAIDGLEVVAALSAVHDGQHTILTASAPTKTLMEAAQDAQLAAFFTKPLFLDDVDETIKKVSDAAKAQTSVSLAFLEIDSNGRLAYANGLARSYCELPDVLLFERSLADVFNEATVTAIQQSKGAWVRLTCCESESFGFVRRTDVSNLLIILPKIEELLQKHPVVQTLVG